MLTEPHTQQMRSGRGDAFLLQLAVALVASAIFMAACAHGIGLNLKLTMPPGRLSEMGIGGPKPVFSISSNPQPLFDNPRLNRQFYVEYDETSDMVVVQEVYDGWERIRLPRAVASEQYRRELNENRWRLLWAEESKRALKESDQQRRGGLLRFEIPWKGQPKIVRSIIGVGGAGLEVTGYRKITVSGKSQWNDQESVATQKQSKFPSLNMEQIASFQIKGNIGSKITVDVNQDSKRQQSLANRILLRYNGDEDDVVKTIELGNTNLSLPSTRFIGYSQSVRGLFGVKTTAQVGPVQLTAIASQEKSSTKGASYTGAIKADQAIIRDVNFLDNRYFDLRARPGLYPPGTKLPQDLQPGDSIIKVELYLQTEEQYAFKCSLFVDPVSRDSFPDGVLERFYFDEEEYQAEKMQQVRYYYHPTEHYIRIDQPSNLSSVGAYIEVIRGDDTLAIGEVNRADTSAYKVLKMIRHESPDPKFVTWGYVWRNVYSLGGPIQDLDNLDVKIYKGKATNTNDRDESDLDYNEDGYYIELLGLDENPRDGRIDQSNQIIDPNAGHIFFPDRRPFMNPVLGDDTIPEIYFEKTTRIRQDSSKFYLLVNESKLQQDFQLGFDVVEGSETVTLNGRRLTRDVDYRIFYDMGKVQFLTDEVLDPTAEVQIDYEQAELFASDKKTLLGARGEYSRGRNFKMGSTVLYKSEKTTDRKPRLGEEQSRFINLDTDLSYSFESQALTALMNKLPLINSAAPSRVQFAGEVGQSFPNPNVEGEVYLDDFEGSQERYSLGVTRGGWHPASQPVNVQDTTRGKLIWYNPYSQFAITDIYEREVRAGEDRTHVLVLRHQPHGSNPAGSWSGVMKAFSAGLYDQGLTKFIELRLKVLSRAGGVIHIDFGKISEDVDGDTVLDTEDGLRPDDRPNGILEEWEDVGLDGLPDAQEEGEGSDPAGDNWAYDSKDPNNYERINGTEGNAKDPDTYGLPDTEDINRSGFLDYERNDYYSFSFPATQSPSVATNNFFVDGSLNDKGWYTVRIPFQDVTASDSIGDPDRSDIRFARIWIDGVAGDSTFQVAIANMELTRNLWEPRDVISADVPRDTSQFPEPEFRVAVVNTEENEDYERPPGVEGFLDKTTGLREKEQSLSIEFENFAPGDTGITEKIPYRPQDLTGYRRLDMWVHGDSLRPNIKYFFRVGNDAQNYYEYSAAVRPGWDEGRSVAMVFDEMTPLKIELQAIRDSVNQGLLDADREVKEISRGPYRVVRSPSLTQIQYYAIGIVNTLPVQIPIDSTKTVDTNTISLGAYDSFADTLASGVIWFNELRLTEVRRDRGLAAFASASIALGDVMSFSADYQRQDAYFRKLTGGGRTNLGSGRESTTQGFRFSFQLDKLLPTSWRASVPISYSWSKSVQTPRLITGSDIVVPEDRLEEQQSVTTRWDVSVRESFRADSKNPLFSVLLNQFKSNFAFSKSESRTPNDPVNTSERYTAQASYDLAKPRDPHGIKIFYPLRFLFFPASVADAGFWPFPTRLGLNGNLTRTLEYRQPLRGQPIERFTRNFKGKLSTAADPFPGMQLSYNMDTDRDLEDPDLVKLSLNPKEFRLGQERTFRESFSASWGPNISSIITGTRVSFSSTHSENLDPKRQTAGTRRVDNSRSLTLSASLNLQKFFGQNKPRTAPAAKEAERPVFRPQEQKEELPSLDSLRAVVGDSLAADSLLADMGEEEEEEKPKLPGIPVWEYPLRLVRFFTNRIDPISGQWKREKRLSQNGFLARPSLWYRLGLSENPGVNSISVTGSAAQIDMESEATSYSLSSGVALPLGVRVGTRYAYGVREETNRPTKDVTVTFPEFNFNFGELYILKFTDLFASSFSLDSKYSRSERRTVNRVDDFTEGQNITTSFSPFLSTKISWKFAPAFSTTVKLDRGSNERQSFFTRGPDRGKLETSTIDYSNAITINNGYTFRGGSQVKLPLLGTLKIKTQMSVNLDLSRSSSKSEKRDPGRPVSEIDAKSDFTVQARASYSFSSNIKGFVTARWRDSSNKKTNRTTHLRELGFSAEIRF